MIKQFYLYVLALQGDIVSIDSSQLNVLWAVTNGLMPGGGMVGGVLSGVVADYFGR